MQINHDDPILTAYALGELPDDEAARVESALKDDSEAQRIVSEVRHVEATLRAELAAEPTVGLTDEQRSAVESQIDGGSTGGTSQVLSGPIPIEQGARDSPGDAPLIETSRRGWRVAGGFALAACLVAGFVWVASISDWFQPDRTGTPDEVAAAEKQSRADGAQNERSDFTMDQMVDDARMFAEAPADSDAARRNSARSRSLPTAGADAEPARERTFAGPAMESERRQQGVGIPGGGGGFGGGGGAVQSPAPQPDATLRRFQDDDRNLPLDRDDGEARGEAANTESYQHIVENPFISPHGEGALSTFSIDVDTASYSNVRRFLNSGQLPPSDAVRIEEFVNYFNYDYDAPTGEHPFSVDLEVGAAPWQPAHRLVRIGLKGTEIDVQNRPATSLVFLIDVSGSMNDANKLPLLKRSMKMLIDNLTPDDKVAIVVYAGAAGLALPSTYCYDRETILAAIDDLRSGGSTNGGAGINLAYDVAQQNFIPGGINRVVLATDGDFNVGVSDDAGLEKLIEEKRETGVFLSVLGFGTGNTKDSRMELLADKGNGNYAYIDSLDEARKVLINEMGGTLMTIARDLKIQVEFNPRTVQAHRLIGYENRLLEAHEFRDDARDAGELGAGLTVTALYEVVPTGVPFEHKDAVGFADESDQDDEAVESELSDELLVVRLRYKRPDEDTATELAFPLTDGGESTASEDFRFASAVAAFGMLLRDSEYKGEASYEMVLELAGAHALDAERPQGFGGGGGLREVDEVDEDVAEPEPQRASLREGFIELVRKAAELARD